MWLQRAMKGSKRKRADQLSRLQVGDTYRLEEIVGSRNVLSKIIQSKAVQSEQHWIN